MFFVTRGENVSLILSLVKQKNAEGGFIGGMELRNNGQYFTIKSGNSGARCEYFRNEKYESKGWISYIFLFFPKITNRSNIIVLQSKIKILFVLELNDVNL